MASEATPTPQTKSFIGRGPNCIPKAPTNPDDRTMIHIRPFPHDKYKRYRWTNEQSSLIAKLFWQKCATRTKDKLSKDRSNAIRLAGDAHPGQGVEYMHEYNPWWCSADVWSQMCDQWRDPIWLKRRKTAAENRAAGSASKGEPIHWLDVYVATRDGLPDAVKTARYPVGTPRPHIDQELWEKASIVKKNYVKGQGRRTRPSIYGSGSTQSSQFSTYPAELLLTLGGHLGAMDPEELARAVSAAAAAQEQEQQQHGDEVYLISSKTTFTYVLEWRSWFDILVIIKHVLLFC
ncbi:hypothetical protein DCAR_0312081 [Daucus carota subsp. sativus]|uniref:Uncharacterized protein n=1 Tax=Daucus carota subsp. sativus TaxID=79200 RepID=A0AAF1AUK1_DAUCS|nr:hypothetical protein DCAR_0312081 [Daucus carota subsp. sativus]